MLKRIRDDRIDQGLGGSPEQCEAMVSTARALVEARVDVEEVPGAILRAACGLWISYAFGLSADRFRRLEFERDRSEGEFLLPSDRLASITSKSRNRSFWTESGAGELLASYVKRGGLIARHDSRSS